MDTPNRTDRTAPPKIVVPKTAIEISPAIKDKFQLFYMSEIFYGEDDIQIGEHISREEFDEFVEYQTNYRLRFAYNNGALFWVCPRESEIHQQTSLFFVELVGSYRTVYGSSLILSTGDSQQSNGGYVRQPDFGFHSMGRVESRIRNGNVIGEVMYSQSLASGHECAEGYLSGLSDVLGVILIDLEHSWPKRNGEYDPDRGKMVYYYYPESTTGAPIVPSSVVSFGPSPITDADVDAIVATTHCEKAAIAGYGLGPTAACTAPNMLGYVVRIPANVLLRVNRLGDMPSSPFDLAIDLFELQQRIRVGVMSMAN